jgi:hypothetical protein
MLHVHSGDCAAANLKAAGTAGLMTVWTDLLMQGPLRPQIGLEAYRRERAAWLSASTGGARTPATCLQLLERQDQALTAWAEHDETVLWVDACLYDQAILVRLLTWFGAFPAALARLRLICVGEYPGVTPFHGLGQLPTAALAQLLPGRQAVTPAMVALAQQAWEAMTTGDPQALVALARGSTPPLPHLQAALGRWLEHFPSTHNGLCRLQQEVLEALDTDAELTPVALFQRVSAREVPAFFGDTLLWKLINEMAFGKAPLLALDAGRALPLWEPQGLDARRVRLTPLGRRVAAGQADAIALNGIDRWLGGVHLLGDTESPWRWNRQTTRLESRQF